MWRTTGSSDYLSFLIKIHQGLPKTLMKKDLYKLIPAQYKVFLYSSRKIRQPPYVHIYISSVNLDNFIISRLNNQDVMQTIRNEFTLNR